MQSMKKGTGILDLTEKEKEEHAQGKRSLKTMVKRALLKRKTL